MSNIMTEIHDDYEICDISDEIEDTINTSDNDDKSIMKSSIVGIGVGVSIGTLVAFAGYIWRFWAPIQNLGNFYNSMVTTGAYVERIFELLDEDEDITDRPNAKELPPIRGHVQFDKVNFSYEKGNSAICHSMDGPRDYYTK